MTDEPIKWNDIRIAAQDLGSAMRPLLESGNVPDWAVRLSDAIDEANEFVADRAMEEPT